jgi:hypothetical protein
MKKKGGESDVRNKSKVGRKKLIQGERESISKGLKQGE